MFQTYASSKMMITEKQPKDTSFNQKHLAVWGDVGKDAMQQWQDRFAKRQSCQYHQCILCP